MPESIKRKCLRCDKMFVSVDRRKNWICKPCKSKHDPYCKSRVSTAGLREQTKTSYDG